MAESEDKPHLEEQVADDIGGVQGEEDDSDSAPAQIASPGSPPDMPVPDAGEIEWAGALVKKPPRA